MKLISFKINIKSVCAWRFRNGSNFLTMTFLDFVYFLFSLSKARHYKSLKDSSIQFTTIRHFRNHGVVKSFCTCTLGESDDLFRLILAIVTVDRNLPHFFMCFYSMQLFKNSFEQRREIS